MLTIHKVMKKLYPGITITKEDLVTIPTHAYLFLPYWSDPRQSGHMDINGMRPMVQLL